MYTEGPWMMKCPQMADARKNKEKYDKRDKHPQPGRAGYYLLYAAGGEYGPHDSPSKDLTTAILRASRQPF